MKNENKLNDAIQAAKALCDIIENEDKMFAEKIVSLITEFLVDNEPERKNEFNIFNFVSNDKARPLLCGVFHDQGYAVATDGKVLVATKKDYNMFNDGEVYDKYDNKIEGNYPKWESVFPKAYDDYERAEFDVNELMSIRKKFNAHLKTLPKTRRKVGHRGVYKLYNAYFDLDYLIKLGSLTNVLYVNPDRAAVNVQDDFKALMMPIRFNSFDGVHNAYLVYDDEVIMSL